MSQWLPRAWNPPGPGQEYPSCWAEPTALAQAPWVCVGKCGHVCLSEVQPVCLLRPWWKQDLGLKLSSSANTASFSSPLAPGCSVCLAISPFANGEPQSDRTLAAPPEDPSYRSPAGLDMKGGEAPKVGELSLPGLASTQRRRDHVRGPGLVSHPCFRLPEMLNSLPASAFFFFFNYPSKFLSPVLPLPARKILLNFPEPSPLNRPMLCSQNQRFHGYIIRGYQRTSYHFSAC